VDDVELNIPRFKMEYDVNSLKEVLASMGMKEAFKVNADFTGMGYGGLYISNVKHKAVIEVNEEGSEAAGVTEVEVRFTGLIENPPSFIADRPFLFFITDDTTGTILFMGKMYDAEKN
jgi:serpin B